jgi:hypothetical protein
MRNESSLPYLLSRTLLVNVISYYLLGINADYV